MRITVERYLRKRVAVANRDGDFGVFVPVSSDRLWEALGSSASNLSTSKSGGYLPIFRHSSFSEILEVFE